jgi:hypothetical protein
MLTEKHEIEKMVIPAVPDYKRNFVEIMGGYLCGRPMFYNVIEFDFRLLNVEQIKAFNEDRRISSKGVDVMAYASKFLSERVDEKSLSKARTTLSEGIKNLENYEVRERTVAGRQNLKGDLNLPPYVGIAGGRAPFEGGIQETKPSAYSSFVLPKEQRSEYLSNLSKTLFGTFEDLKEGFKSESNDRSFEILIRSLLTKEETSLTHVKTINDYMRSVHGDVNMVCKLEEFFGKYGLKELYRLPEEGKLKVLEEAGFRIMHPTLERIASIDSIRGIGCLASFLGIMISSIGLLNLNTVIFCSGIPLAGGGFYFYLGSSRNIVKNDRNFLAQAGSLQ